MKLNLVRKKLKWNYKPFEIPEEILDEWRKIGKNGMKIGKKMARKLTSKKNLKIKRELEKNFINSDLRRFRKNNF